MKSALIALSLIGVLTSCKALKAIDSVNDTPKKMDETLSEIRKSNDGISSTNESIRMQKMKLSLDDMLTERNTKILKPVAFGMIAGAKKFGEAATAEELVEYTYVLLKQLRNEKLDDSLKDENGNFPKDVVAAFDHKKMVDLNQILTIAGFCPQEKVADIVGQQILSEEGEGLYDDAAYVFLMARVMFLGTYLQETLLADPINNVKTMRETITRLGYIDSILKSSFKEKVKMDIDGFIKEEPIVASLYDEDGKMADSWNAPKLWKKVLKRFDQDLKDGNIMAGTRANQTAVNNEIASLKLTVQNYIDSWK